MIPDDRDHHVTSFPTRLVGVTAVLTLAVLAWFSWFVYDAYKFVRDTNTRIVGLEQARGDIVHLDEVLTMSASMAAATGESEWIDRYRNFEPKLDAAIKQAIDVAQRSDVADAIRETDAANVELVKMENQAFALIYARRLEEARAILSGTSYSDQKQLYAGGMEKLLRGIRAERDAAVASQRTATLGSMLTMGFVAVVIIVAWLILLTRVREWRTAMAKNVGDLARAEEALRTSHDDLERRVTDPTRELEDEIGERKQAEHELAESREQLQGLADYMQVALSSMSDGISILDGDLNIVTFNQRYVDLLNFPEGLVREGRSIVDVTEFAAKRGDYGSQFDGDIDDVVAARLKQLKSNEENLIENITPTGRIVEYRSSPIKGGGCVMIMHDITERRQAEGALRESEQRLLAMLRESPVSVGLIKTTDNTVAFANARYDSMFGFEKGALIGRTTPELFVDTRDRDALLDDFNKEGSVYDRELRLQRSDGTAFWGLVTLLPFEYEGASARLVWIYDTTERKQAERAIEEKEAQLRVVLDYMPGGIRLVDEDRNYVFFNARYLELYDFPEGLLNVGEPYRIENLYQAKRGDFGPGDPEALTDKWIVSLARETEPQSWERTTVAGKILEVSTGPTPKGGYVSIVTDITERKRMEEELQEAYGIIKDQKERMEDELNIGREIQMSMVPLKFPPFPDHDEFSLFATLKPAREVGGDFYDYYFIDEERLCFCIGDVSGKGVPAALFMAMAKTVIRSRAVDDRSTASILTHVNDELSIDNDQCMFVTVFSGILNIRTGELLYTNAGHNPPYLKRKDGTLQRLDQRHGMVIGAVEGMVYAEGRDTMEPGDLLLLYTDGVTEAMDVERRQFSENRLIQILTSMGTDDADKLVANTVVAVKAFEGKAEQADDITVLALAFHGSPKDALLAERRIVIKNHLPEIAAVNKEFETFAEEFGVPRPTAVKFELIFDELLSNIIAYAYPDKGDHDIVVKIGLAGERLVVTITDNGVPFNPLTIVKPRTDLALQEREVGGMGIHLVRNLVDDVSYQRRIDKNVLTLVSHLQQNDSAA